MAVLLWGTTLFISLYILVRGAGYFIEGAKHVGAAFGMSTFAIGVVIIGFGTSIPELAASIAAVLHGSTEIVAANVVGSNITNILLIVGILAVAGGRIAINRELIKSELPAFFIATIMFLLTAWDGIVDRIEAILLVGTFGAYIWYLFSEAGHIDRVAMLKSGVRPRLEARAVFLLVMGLTAVLVGAAFSIDAVVAVAEWLFVPVEIVTITAIALGTSLPELFVSLRAIKEGQKELAIANIFGSNIFNVLAVVGISGLLTPLGLGEVVMVVGLPIFLVASLTFFATAAARQILPWEGVVFLLIFIFFVMKMVLFI